MLLVKAIRTGSTPSEDPIKISLSFLILFLFPLAQAFADSRTTSLKDRVLVMVSYDLSRPPHAVSAVVEGMDLDGNAQVSFEFIQDGSRQTTKDIFPISSLVKETPALQGYKTNDVVCLAAPARLGPTGTNIRIDHIFANGAVEVRSQEFFVQGFLFFRKKEIINIKALQFCHLNSHGSPL